MAALRQGTGAGWPPTPPSDTEKAAYENLSADLQCLLREFKVAFQTWAKVAELAEWADRWSDKAACMTNSLAAYLFRHGDPG